jgi:hypothetical protein
MKYTNRTGKERFISSLTNNDNNRKKELIYLQPLDIHEEAPYSSTSLYILDHNFEDNAEWKIRQ